MRSLHFAELEKEDTDDVARAENEFKAFDRDGDEYVDMTEIAWGESRKGNYLPDQFVKHIIEQFGSDEDGKPKNTEHPTHLDKNGFVAWRLSLYGKAFTTNGSKLPYSVEDCLRCRKVLELAGLHKVIEMSYILTLTMDRKEIMKATRTGGKPPAMMRHMAEFSLACLVHSAFIFFFFSLDAQDYYGFARHTGLGSWSVANYDFSYLSEFQYDSGERECLLNQQLLQLMTLNPNNVSFSLKDLNADFDKNFPDSFEERGISFDDAQTYCDGRYYVNAHIAAFAGTLIMVMSVSSRIKSLCAKRSLRYMIAVANDMQEPHIFFLFEDVLTFITDCFLKMYLILYGSNYYHTNPLLFATQLFLLFFLADFIRTGIMSFTQPSRRIMEMEVKEFSRLFKSQIQLMPHQHMEQKKIEDLQKHGKDDDDDAYDSKPLSWFDWFLVRCCYCEWRKGDAGVNSWLSAADRFENKHGYRAVPLTAHGYWVALALSREQYTRVMEHGEKLGDSETLKEENCGFVIIFDQQNHPVAETPLTWFVQDPLCNLVFMFSFSKDLLTKTCGLFGTRTQTFMDTIYNGIEDLVSGKIFFWSELITLFSFPHISFYNSVLNGKMQVKRADPKAPRNTPGYDRGLVPVRHRIADTKSETLGFQCIITVMTEVKTNFGWCKMILGYCTVVVCVVLMYFYYW